jgi:copper homeostasis protein (lipoprotein)
MRVAGWLLGSMSAVAMLVVSLAEPAAAMPNPIVLPATFVGDTPCADCAAIHATVTMYGDGSFFMRDTYVGRNVTRVITGTWRYDDASSNLTLLAPGEPTTSFHVTDPRTLQMLDAQGKPLPVGLTGTLVLSDKVDRFHDTTRWRGSLLASPDFARFTECATARSYSISHTLEYPALMKAYADAHPQPGAPVLAQFDGHIADTPRADGAGTQENLVVEKMDSASAAETCGSGAQQPVTLESYTWVLTELGGKAVVLPQDAVVPHLVFDGGAKRVSGSTGCNNLTGSYERDGEHLKFSPLATTRMMCPAGMDREADFLTAMERVRSFTIAGDTLELFADGALLAKFKAPAAH